MYDAVRLFASALHDLDKSQAISIRPLSCDKEEPWTYGNTVTNYMRMVSLNVSVLIDNIYHLKDKSD